MDLPSLYAGVYSKLSSTELSEADLHLIEAMKVSCVYNYNALAKQ